MLENMHVLNQPEFSFKAKPNELKIILYQTRGRKIRLLSKIWYIL